MKGVFFSEGLDPFSDNKSGIEKKVYSQIQCLRKFAKLKPVCINFDRNDKLDRLVFLMPFINSKREKKRNALAKNVDNTTDFVYIRKPTLTIKFIDILKKIRKKNPQIILIMEIPTYGGSERHGLQRLMNVKEKMVTGKLKQYIDVITTYSDDKYIWGIPCINISNCVEFNDIPVRKEYAPLPNTLRMTCVADFIYYHGADRLIQGIKNYKGKYRIFFNIVGGGAEIPNLKRLAQGMSNIVFHGFLSGDDLNSVFNNTDIAIDALGRHRSGVYYNSSLKGKEYAARGIPSVSAVKTEFDYLPDFPYYMKVPANDSPIRINDIIRFHIQNNIKKDPNEVSNFIRTYSYHRFDYEFGFKKIIFDYICNKIAQNKEG